MAITSVAFYRRGHSCVGLDPGCGPAPWWGRSSWSTCPSLPATLPKFMQGGYVPVGIGLVVVVVVMFVWHYGLNLLHSHVGANLLTWADVHTGIEDGTISRTPGTGVFLASNPDDVPQSLSSHVQMLHSLPEHVRVVTILTETVPVVVRAATSSRSPTTTTESSRCWCTPASWRPRTCRCSWTSWRSAATTDYTRERAACPACPSCPTTPST